MNKIITAVKCLGVFILGLTEILFQLMAYQMISFRLCSERKFKTVIAGGALDQSGLTKFLLLTLLMMSIAVLAYCLAISISRQKWWRIACLTAFPFTVAIPVGATLMYSWELARYIAVMGVTPDRIAGARLGILLFFMPIFSIAAYFAGAKPIKRLVFTGVACLFGAYLAFMATDAAARKSISNHPRPRLCGPNNVGVPDTPETSPCYGLKEIVFGVPKPIR